MQGTHQAAVPKSTLQDARYGYPEPTDVAMMKCPDCGSLVSRVILTQRAKLGGQVVRRRACNACAHRWYSIQPPEELVSKYQLVWKKSSGKPCYLKEVKPHEQS